MERWRRGIHELLARYQSRGEIDCPIDIVEAANSWVNLMFGTFMERLLALGRSPRRSGFQTPELRRHAETVALSFAMRLKGRPGDGEATPGR